MDVCAVVAVGVADVSVPADVRRIIISLSLGTDMDASRPSPPTSTMMVSATATVALPVAAPLPETDSAAMALIMGRTSSSRVDDGGCRMRDNDAF